MKEKGQKTPAEDTVDSYIGRFEPETQEKLREIRELILKTACGCAEKISWGAPTYYKDGYLLQFAANQKHLGFYTSPATLLAFRDELRSYKTNEKNTVQFPYDGELPRALIQRMVQFRVEENRAFKGHTP